MYRKPSRFVETSDLKSSAVYSVNGLVKKMPALLTSTSIDLKRDIAVSTILAAVAGSPMSPSTRATWLEAATSVDWVTFRELATTLKPRSANAFTIPAPIPCEAPVTMAVLCGPLIVVYLENVCHQRNSIQGTAEARNNPSPSVGAFRSVPSRAPAPSRSRNPLSRGAGPRDRQP